MRTDPARPFGRDLAPPGAGLPGRHFQDGVSQSGRERNHLFVNLGGRQFSDVSGVSGLDDPADGRAFALLDFDADGWQDLAVVNANAPLFQLYRNRLGELGLSGRSLRLRLVGGSRGDQPDPAWSNRDGIGARLEIELDDAVLVRELRAGEGLAAQNSALLRVGIGERSSARAVRIRWPSGRSSELRDVPAGATISVYENPAQSPAPGGSSRTP